MWKNNLLKMEHYKDNMDEPVPEKRPVKCNIFEYYIISK